ncbi:hypothetical protein SAMN05192529_12727 [Arachidicoccus rhizosphaerae]|uniref:Uncharacterized protein n=1 Tax=Arachidicoccus rhizosphaerae TaxID=551991 RepID=A0A1H4C4A5_9BACT|nr:hypothetical protein SAMN05192529_12727 [Arachidicoccus rhizosphaerae]
MDTDSILKVNASFKINSPGITKQQLYSINGNDTTWQLVEI